MTLFLFVYAIRLVGCLKHCKPPLSHIKSVDQCLAAVVSGIIALLWTASQASGMAEGSPPSPKPQASQAASTPRTNAVLVFGATGRLGTEVVSQV